MALTDGQYKQVLKYVDGQMDTDEKKAFEDLLLQNRELNDEVAFYKEVRLLSESVEQKTRNVDLISDEEKKSNGDDVWSILSQAREKWESQHEGFLKLKYGISEAKNIPTEEHKIEIKRINITRWLVAASLIGLISLGAFWWYSEDRKDGSKTAVNKTKADSAVVTNNTATDSMENIIQIQPTPPQENTSSKNIAGNKGKEKRVTLFADNFRPDAAPLDKEGPLESAFVYYENKQYEKASRDFEKADIGPVTRGDAEDNRRLMAFYILYYKALSYMAADTNTSNTIAALKKAITTSPDERWKVKAQWYLALAHLKNGEAKTAQQFLTQVAGHDEAKELKQKAIALSKELNEE